MASDDRALPGAVLFALVPLAMATLAATASAAAATVDSIEFYNASLDHYFISSLPTEIAALDGGRFPGWARTGYSFKVFPTQADGGPTALPVCRFYIPPEHGDSHFFSASASECAAEVENIATNPSYSNYVEETPNAFYIALPDLGTGACAAGTTPVYRLWNQRTDSNHRYTTDVVVKAQMFARGYAAEGYGPDATAMCSPSSAPLFEQTRVSSDTPFNATCNGTLQTAGLYLDAEVEPTLAVDPLDQTHFIAVYQQDRWADGGSQGIVTAVSFDSGQSWARTIVPSSRCAGGNAGNGNDFPRVSNPWVTIAADGTAYQTALEFGGDVLSPGSSSAVTVSKSNDGGRTWSVPLPLISDGSAFFNDKDSITADLTDARYAYAAWDRLTQDDRGPALFARTTDGGATWEPARAVYDPGVHRQTINAHVAVLPDGTLLLFFDELNTNGPANASLVVLRSGDKGQTWSTPITIAQALSVGTTDPDTGKPVRDQSIIGDIHVGTNGVVGVVWQDSRFSAGARDAIAYAQSSDGGITWTGPVRVSAVASVPAFDPIVHIRHDGGIGVTYFDFRSNRSDDNALQTDYWLAESSDGGATWSETHVAGPFDLHYAPFANGFFLGDNQSLASVGDVFYPIYARTNADLANRTDIFISAIEPSSAVERFAATNQTRSLDGRAWSAPYIGEKVDPPVIAEAWRWSLDAALRRALLSRKSRR